MERASAPAVIADRSRGALIMLAPKHAPTPITATGRLSHLMDEHELMAAGGRVGFVTASPNREAKSPAWAKAEFRWHQLELFSRTARSRPQYPARLWACFSDSAPARASCVKWESGIP